MAGIRVSKLCRLFNVGPKELIAFLSSKSVMVSSNPNFKVPESALELLQQEYGHNANIEAIEKTPVVDISVDNLEETKIQPVESNTEPEMPLVIPDSPFKIGTSGKYKLLIKTVTNCIYHYEYLLLDAEGKEYKTISDYLYNEGQLLRCMVNLKGERGRLVVDSVAVCKKQDMATLVKIIIKPEPKLVISPSFKSTIENRPIQKQKTKKKSTRFNQKPKKKRAKRMIHYDKLSGYGQNNYEPTLYKGGVHLIYTPMGNKR